VIREVEVDLLKQALRASGGDRRKAASLLGLTQRELRYRLSKYNLQGD